MRGDWPLATTEDHHAWGPLFNYQVRLFHEGSSDLMKCVNTNGGYDGAHPGGDGLDPASYGAVGYADSDKNGGDAFDDYPNAPRILYQGADAKKNQIKFGIHDFWSAQWLFYRSAETQPVKDFVAALNTFASNSTNLATYLPAKAPFWATQGEMKVEKANDFAYPTFK
jgi:hypothetical protein